MYKVLFFLFALFFIACSSHQPQSEPEKPTFFTLQTPTSLLDVTGSLKLSDIADSVWYVPLETNEK